MILKCDMLTQSHKEQSVNAELAEKNYDGHTFILFEKIIDKPDKTYPFSFVVSSFF